MAQHRSFYVLVPVSQNDESRFLKSKRIIIVLDYFQALILSETQCSAENVTDARSERENNKGYIFVRSQH